MTRWTPGDLSRCSQGGACTIPVVRKGREKGRERTVQLRVWAVPRVSPTKGAHAPRLEEALRRPCGGWGRGRRPPGPTHGGAPPGGAPSRAPRAHRRLGREGERGRGRGGRAEEE